MRAKDIITALFSYADKRQHAFSLANAYIHEWESDFFSVTKSGLTSEVEVKVVRGDFRADFKKEKKHTLLKDVFSNARSADRTKCPHHFYFCSPPDVISLTDVPPYAGLIHILFDDIHNPYIEVVKKAPKLHNDRTDIADLLLVKFYHRYRKLLDINRNLLDQIENFSQHPERGVSIEPPIDAVKNNSKKIVNKNPQSASVKEVDKLFKFKELERGAIVFCDSVTDPYIEIRYKKPNPDAQLWGVEIRDDAMKRRFSGWSRVEIPDEQDALLKLNDARKLFRETDHIFTKSGKKPTVYEV